MTLNELSKEQEIAVKHPGHILLTACPGSGKTRVLIHKLAYDIQHLKENRKAAAVTFTVRASEEISRRLNDMDIDTDKAWSGTLHSFCLEWVLSPYSCYLPELQQGYSIADDNHCNELMSTLKTEHGLNPYSSIDLKFNRNGGFLEKEATKVKILNVFYEILKQEKLINFELVLHYSYKLLAMIPDIAKTISKIFKTICVDEYQDTQDLLYAIIGQIIQAGDGKTTLFLVGDIDQAIYHSLGGVAKSLDEIKAEIKCNEVTQLNLSGNYRSSQKIIDFYRQFQTKDIQIKAIGHNAKPPSNISFNHTIHKDNLIEEIARLIQLSLDQGIPENEITILVPQWWLIVSVSKQLRILLPKTNFDASGLTPMSKHRNNIWYKLSRLFLSSPTPSLYYARYKWAQEIIDEFYQQTETEFKVQYSNAKQLLKLIRSINSKKELGIEYLSDCFQQFLSKVDIDYRKFPFLKSNWELFFESLEERMEDKSSPSDIASFKKFYREMTGIVINTCVGVKGEEYEAVIAYGLLEGYLPNWNDIFHGDPVTASKKSLYVICSRAKTNLHLISERGRSTKRGAPLITTPILSNYNYRFDKV